MEESILISIRKMLGPSETYTHFDNDIIIHINSAFNVLHQLGVGPEEGFYIIDDSTTWDEYLKNPGLLQSVKYYVYLKVKKGFDPPQNSFLVDNIDKDIKEYEWRINVMINGGEY